MMEVEDRESWGYIAFVITYRSISHCGAETDSLSWSMIIPSGHVLPCRYEEQFSKSMVRYLSTCHFSGLGEGVGRGRQNRKSCTVSCPPYSLLDLQCARL
jgi:hypothetical protein